MDVMQEYYRNIIIVNIAKDAELVKKKTSLTVLSALSVYRTNPKKYFIVKSAISVVINNKNSIVTIAYSASI